MSYDSFCAIHEDLLEWLLEAEDRLAAMEPLANELEAVKNQFEVNNDYMSELDKYQSTVGEVRLLQT